MPPRSGIPKSSHGPIIQPMSVTQYMRVAGLHVEAVRHVLRRLDREAAVRVHRALRPPGGAGRVDEHQRIFGVGPLGVARRRPARPTRSRPQAIARVRIGASRAERAARRSRARTDGAAATASSATAFIATRWPRRQKPSAVMTTRASASCSRVGDGVGAVAGEERQHDAADLDDGEERGDELRPHRHEERDAVALARCRAIAARWRSGSTSARSSRVGQRRASSPSSPSQRMARRGARPACRSTCRGSCGRCSCGRRRTSAPTAGAAREVEHLAVRLVELDAEIVEHRAPEPFGIGGRAPHAARRSCRRPWRRMNASSRLRSMYSGDGRQAMSPPNSKFMAEGSWALCHRLRRRSRPRIGDEWASREPWQGARASTARRPIHHSVEQTLHAFDH